MEVLPTGGEMRVGALSRRIVSWNQAAPVTNSQVPTIFNWGPSLSNPTYSISYEVSEGVNPEVIS